MIKNVGRYWKSIVAGVGAVATVGVALAPDNKWVAVAVAVATALGVYGVRNTASPVAKPAAAPAEPAKKG